MKRVLILCLFLFITKSSSWGNTTFFPPLLPMGVNSPIQNYNNNITSANDPFSNPVGMNVSAVSRIEQTLFGRSFDGQNIAFRLSRIEKSLFNTTYPNSTVAQRIDNIILNYNQINRYPNISRNVLSDMESRVFNQKFSQSSPERRIERLEQQIFGAVQSGDMDSRYEALVNASKNYNSNAVNPYYSSPALAKGGLKGILGNIIGNTLMGGSMTGFTPPVNPYYNNFGYNPYGGLDPGSYGLYRGMRSNNGLGGYSYHDNFNNYGSGTGVRILN